MKPGYLGRPVTFTFVVSYFSTFLLLINGIAMLDVSGDIAESEFVDEDEIIHEMETQLKSKTCGELSNYPVPCIKKGCNLNEVTGECRDAHTHPKSQQMRKIYSISIPKMRRKRKAEKKCYYFDLSRRMCALSGCKYNNDLKKCVNLDGSIDDPSIMAKPSTPSTDKLQETSTAKTYQFMEEPTTEYCKKYYGKPRACGYAGCGFDKWTHRCLAGSLRSNYSSSQRGKSDVGDDDGKKISKDGDDDGKEKSKSGDEDGKGKSKGLDDKRKGKSDDVDDEGKSKAGDDDGKGKSKNGDGDQKGKSKDGGDDGKGKSKDGDDEGKGKSEDGDGEGKGKSKHGDRDKDGKGKSKGGNEDEDGKGKTKDGNDDGKGKSKDGKDDGKVKSKDGDDDGKGKSKAGDDGGKGKSKDGDDDRKGKSKEGDDDGKGKSKEGDDDGKGKSKDGDDAGKGKSTDGDDAGKGKSKDGDDDGKGKSKDGEDDGKGKSKDKEDDGKGKSKEGDDDGKGKSKEGDDDGKGKSKDREDDGKGKSKDGEDDGKGKSKEGDDDGKGKSKEGDDDGKGKPKDGDDDGKAAVTPTVVESCSQFKSDRSNCVKAGTDCIFNESSKDCIQAKDLKPADGGKSQKYCNSLYGNNKTCDAAGCEYDQKLKKCHSGEANKSSDSVSITYVETKSAKSKHTAAECAELHKSPRGCLFAGCKFDEGSNKCLVGTAEVISIGKDMSAAQIAAKYLTADECALFKKKRRSCRMVGCRYLDHNEVCVPGQAIPSKKNCSALNGKPVPCIQQGCLYDQKNKKCFISDFHEFSHTINYVRVKSTHKKLQKEECAQLDGSAKGCAFAQCKYDAGTTKCLEGIENKGGGNQKGKQLTTVECAFFNNKLRACGYAGCRYTTTNHKCIAETSAKAGCGVMNGDQGSCTEAGCVYDKVKHKCIEKPKGTVGRTVGGGDSRASTVACSKFNGKRASCTKAGCAYDKGARTCSSVDNEVDDEKETEEEIDGKDCGRFNKKPKKCIHEGCEYDKSTKTCSTGGEDGSDVLDGGDDVCAEYDGKRKSCTEQTGCKYNKSTKKCSTGSGINGTLSGSEDPCAQYKGKLNECNHAGCHYEKQTKECTVKDDEEEEKEGTAGRGDDVTPEAPEDCEDHDGKQRRCTRAGCKYDPATNKCTAGTPIIL